MGSAVGASVDLKTSLSTYRGVAAGSRPPRQHRTPRETEHQVFCFFCLHWASWRPCLRVFVPQSLYQLFLRPCSQRQRAVPQSLQSLFQSPCWHWPVPQSLHWLFLLAPVVAAARGAVLAVALPEPVLALVLAAVLALALLAPVVAAVHGAVLAVDLPEPELALARAVVLALALLAPVFALLWGLFRSPLHLLLQNP
jgi:hypothetical protein